MFQVVIIIFYYIFINQIILPLINSVWFHPLPIEFSYLSSYGSGSRKRYTLKHLLMCLEEGGVLEVVLPVRRQMTYLRKGSAWINRGQEKTMQINCKIKFTNDSFQRFY